MGEIESRTELALIMAKKDGQVWEGLDVIMRNAYLHAADTEIERSNKPVVEEGTPVPFEGCPVCGDTGKVGGKDCYDCNPTGKREVAVAVVIEPDKAQVKKPVKLLKGQYYCTKCGFAHFETKAMGKKHLKHKGDLPAPAPLESPKQSAQQPDSGPEITPETKEAIEARFGPGPFTPGELGTMAEEFNLKEE